MLLLPLPLILGSASRTRLACPLLLPLSRPSRLTHAPLMLRASPSGGRPPLLTAAPRRPKTPPSPPPDSPPPASPPRATQRATQRSLLLQPALPPMAVRRWPRRWLCANPPARIVSRSENLHFQGFFIYFSKDAQEISLKKAQTKSRLCPKIDCGSRPLLAMQAKAGLRSSAARRRVAPPLQSRRRRLAAGLLSALIE